MYDLTMKIIQKRLAKYQMHATIKTDDQFKTNEKFTKRVDSEQKLLAKIHTKISKMHKKEQSLRINHV